MSMIDELRQRPHGGFLSLSAEQKQQLDQEVNDLLPQTNYFGSKPADKAIPVGYCTILVNDNVFYY